MNPIKQMALSNCLSLGSNLNTKGDETSSTQSSPNAGREYRVAVESNSYNEMWSTISNLDGEDNMSRVLQPNRECVQDVLRLARPSALTRLVSCYLDHSENTTQLCLLLHSSLRRARSLYAPLHDLIDLNLCSLTQSQCDFAFQVFLQFDSDSLDNPFPSPDSLNLEHICTSFSHLKLQFDRRLRRSRSVALSAIRSLLLVCPALPRKEVARIRMQQLDAAARGAFVLDNDLRTINCLVALLHSAINEDKILVRLALEGGPDRHLIREVLKQLTKNYINFSHQLKDIEERICLCLNTVNRARNLLLYHIYHHQTLLLGDHRLRQREEIVSNSYQDLNNNNSSVLQDEAFSPC